MAVGGIIAIYVTDITRVGLKSACVHILKVGSCVLSNKKKIKVGTPALG